MCIQRHKGILLRVCSKTIRPAFFSIRIEWITTTPSWDSYGFWKQTHVLMKYDQCREGKGVTWCKCTMYEWLKRTKIKMQLRPYSKLRSWWKLIAAGEERNNLSVGVAQVGFPWFSGCSTPRYVEEQIRLVGYVKEKCQWGGGKTCWGYVKKLMGRNWGEEDHIILYSYAWNCQE